MPPRPSSYDEECSRHEVQVIVRDEADRRLIVHVLIIKRGRHGFGLTMGEPVDVNGVHLEAGDFLAPTPSMTDVWDIRDQPSPLICVFWRQRFDFSRRSAGGYMHRNPIFGRQSLELPGLDEILVEPSDLLAIDSLHTVYFGPLMRWIAAVLWRILLLNPFNLHGSVSNILEIGARRIGADMKTWFQENEVPHERRVGTLLLVMLDNPEGCEVRGARQHPGCPMKYKVAETGYLLPWVLDS